MEKRDLSAIRILVIFLAILGIGSVVYTFGPILFMGEVLSPSWRAHVSEMRRVVDADELHGWASKMLAEHKPASTNVSIPVVELPRSLTKAGFTRSDVFVSIDQTGDGKQRFVSISWPGRDVLYVLIAGAEDLELRTNHWRIKLHKGVYHECWGSGSIEELKR